jgi:pyruvate,water dikinase
MFDEFYRDLFGADDTFGAFRLLQGLDNKSVEAGRILWDLSRQALASPEVRQVLEARAAAEVIPALEGSPAGRAFLADLRGYLDEYGQRGSSFLSLSELSWIEDPTPVIKNLKDYISQPERDLAAELAAQAAERERLLAEVRERLQGYPQPVVGQFEFLLKAAQAANTLQENHNFWIDQRCTYRVRRVLLEFSRRLAEAGVVDQPDDAFYLTVGELRETALQLPALDRRALVAERKAEMAHFHTIQPPPALGTQPPGPPPDSPAGRAMQKFFGGPPQPPTEPGLLRGNAGSAGKTIGPAKVIRSLTEAAKLRPGDILVAETTAPPWTPLFATAAAVVTDTGGILSHCAIVAREYCIPAVVGVGMATALIHDGQMLEVDGDAGIVRILAAD